MAMKSLLRHAIVSSVVPVEFPDNEGLVSAGGQNHLRVLGVGGDLGHPPAQQGNEVSMRI